MAIFIEDLVHTVGMNGIFSTLLAAMCGIIAGSGFATIELKRLLLTIIDETGQETTRGRRTQEMEE